MRVLSMCLCVALAAPCLASIDEHGPKVIFSLKQNAAADSADAARRQSVAVTTGETFTVAIQSGPASGFKWQLDGITSMDMGDPFASIRTDDTKLQNKKKHAATAIQELQDEYTVQPGAHRHVKLGQTSHQLFRFKAAVPGNSILRFAYRRPFDDDSAAPADSVIVEVRADGGSGGEARLSQDL